MNESSWFYCKNGNQQSSVSHLVPDEINPGIYWTRRWIRHAGRSNEE